MEQTLLNQGVTLMLVGMGTVFVFLTALVIAMTLMAAIVRRLQPDVAVAGISNAEIAAIAAAIRQHRRKQADK
jgi:oxaloacetate decarboxylase gamma subunit